MIPSRWINCCISIDRGLRQDTYALVWTIDPTVLLSHQGEWSVTSPLIADSVYTNAMDGLWISVINRAPNTNRPTYDVIRPITVVILHTSMYFVTSINHSYALSSLHPIKCCETHLLVSTSRQYLRSSSSRLISRVQLKYHCTKFHAFFKWWAISTTYYPNRLYLR